MTRHQGNRQTGPVTFTRTTVEANGSLPAARKAVAYYRVSTERQGQSGLGLEAQTDAVRQFLSSQNWRLVSEHTEIESGRKTDRIELQRALAACRLHQAVLVIARLDRLARNAAFLLTLRDHGVEFVATDQPGANRMTVGVMAIVAEHEAEAISVRTKAALAAAKRRGVRLGNPANLSPEARPAGTTASATIRRAYAAQRAHDLAPIIEELQRRGAQSLRQLATALNNAGWTAPRGRRWTASQVRRTLMAKSQSE